MNGTEIRKINVGEYSVTGVAVDIPGSEKQVLQIKCRKGILFCALFSQERIDLIDFAGCIIAPAPDFNEMLSNKPVFISNKAKEMGITENMTGKEIVEAFER